MLGKVPSLAAATLLLAVLATDLHSWFPLPFPNPAAQRTPRWRVDPL